MSRPERHGSVQPPLLQGNTPGSQVQQRERIRRKEVKTCSRFDVNSFIRSKKLGFKVFLMSSLVFLQTISKVLLLYSAILTKNFPSYIDKEKIVSLCVYVFCNKPFKCFISVISLSTVSLLPPPASSCSRVSCWITCSSWGSSWRRCLSRWGPNRYVWKPVWICTSIALGHWEYPVCCY